MWFYLLLILVATYPLMHTPRRSGGKPDGPIHAESR